jgi:hypothetical protein
MNDLRFAIVGDTRPPSPDDTANYPIGIITTIYQDIEAEAPKVPFVISTGDYMFANTYGSQQQPQLNKYLQARSSYSGSSTRPWATTNARVRPQATAPATRPRT